MNLFLPILALVGSLTVPFSQPSTSLQTGMTYSTRNTGLIQLEHKAAYPSAELKRVKIADTASDSRLVKLQAFLKKHNSPLASHAPLIIQLADSYQIDWSLIPAIAGVESTFCKRIPFRSFNCWGWQNGKTRFGDYPQALETVTRTLKTRYYDKGRSTPERIAPVYAPPSSTWAGKVRFLMEKIENYHPTKEEINKV